MKEVLVLFGSLIIALIFSVMIHEVGHLISGSYAGYRFVYIRILGLEVTKNGKGLKCSFSVHGTIGQCIMCPQGKRTVPGLFIMGGCMANLISACVIMLIIAVALLRPDEAADSDYLKIMGWCLVAIVDFFSGIYNVFFGSDTSDGKTYKEIRRDKRNARMYNGLMEVYSCTIEGRELSELPVDIFLPRSVKSSLSAEMLLYDCIRGMEKMDKADTTAEAYKNVRERLKIVAGCRYRRPALLAEELLKSM